MNEGIVKSYFKYLRTSRIYYAWLYLLDLTIATLKSNSLKSAYNLWTDIVSSLNSMPNWLLSIHVDLCIVENEAKRVLESCKCLRFLLISLFKV